MDVPTGIRSTKGAIVRDQLRIGWSSLAGFAAVLGLALLGVTGAFAAQPATAPEAGKQALIPAEDVDAHLPTLYPRANYQWPYATGPYVGNVDPANPPASGVLYTVAGAIDTNRGVPAIPQELRTTFKLGKQQAQYFLLEVEPSMYADGSFARMEESIESAGGAVAQSLGPDGFIVRLTQAGYVAVQGQRGVRFLEPYHPAFKLDPNIGRSPLADPAKALSSVYSLQVRLFPGEDAGAVARAIQAMGGTILAVSPAQVEVEIDRGRLGDIASLDPVYAVYEEGIYVPLDEKATTTVQTGHWNMGAVPYHDAGIDGSGNGVTGTSPQVLSITDTGISIDAGDLSNTKTDAGTPGPTHRKVVDYRATTGFGTGSGDLLGCDSPMTGGFTHGHIVASVALGNASRTAASYGGSWYAIDQNTKRPWAIDGVAKGAKIGVFDCQVSTTVTACDGPTATTLKPGLAYTPASVCDATAGFAQGTLCYGYGRYGARVFNWSWGSTATADLSKYTTYPQQADQFLFEYPDAMLFVAAGNSGRDSDRDFVPDPYRSYAPATVKNGIVVGNHYAANDGGPDFTKRRVQTSGTGPASAASQRITPLIMAPGSDAGSLGQYSTYACRSDDNDQLNPVQCDIPSSQGNSSFAAAAAAGAGLLVRDYFAQGFYPTGTQGDANEVPNLSGALLKTVLMLSGDFLDFTDAYYSSNLYAKYRFNYEQGYGKIQLNNVLPLSTYPSPPSMIVADGGIPGGKNDTTLAGSIGQGAVQSFAFTVNDTSHELRVGLSWVEAQGDLMADDLDLTLVSPSGRTYAGNYFTDDLNRNRALDVGEDCQLAPWCVTGLVDASRWSLPYDSAHQTLANIWDRKNPTEAIFLSPAFNPSDPSSNQLEAGTWTVSVTGVTVPSGPQKYALAIAGAVSRGSWAGIEVHRTVGGADAVVVGDFACDDKAQVVIDEFEDVADPTVGHTPALISSRVLVEVVDPGVDRIYGTADDVVVDTETGLTFTNTVGHVWTSGLIAISAGTVPDPGNGALDAARRPVRPRRVRRHRRDPYGREARDLPRAVRVRRPQVHAVRAERLRGGERRLRARRPRLLHLHLRLPRPVHGPRRADRLPDRDPAVRQRGPRGRRRDPRGRAPRHRQPAELLAVLEGLRRPEPHQQPGRRPVDPEGARFAEEHRLHSLPRPAVCPVHRAGVRHQLHDPDGALHRPVRRRPPARDLREEVRQAGGRPLRVPDVAERERAGAVLLDRLPDGRQRVLRLEQQRDDREPGDVPR